MILASATLAVTSRAALGEAPPEPRAKQIERLIDQLGDADYFVRQRAEAELAEIGFDAYEALETATTHDDLEIATRAAYLLRLLQVRWAQEDDVPEVRELLWDYEFQSPRERLRRIRELARLSDGRGIPALCRVIRFEKSAPLSKRAAIEILGREPLDPSGRARWASTLKERLGGRRPPARWLRAYLELREDPQAALPAWTKLVEEEQTVLERSPEESGPQVVAALLYHLAIVQADQGRQMSAETTAEKARDLAPGKDFQALNAHLDAAFALQRRGRFRWAELEYRHVIDAQAPEFAAIAQVSMSEMLHDQGDYLAAAEALQSALKLDLPLLQTVLAVMRRDMGEVRARMNYFYACHWQERGDPAKERQYLDEAIQHDPSELDVLIARYRLPHPDPDYHRQTLKLIEEAAAGLREEIRRSPDEPRYYNEFAWLIGNTQGDLDEALRHAQKAVRLSPRSGTYLDTLAHVYFARGDLQKAVQCQTRAAQLEPYSGLILRKLELFKAALEGAEKRRQQDQGATATREESQKHEDAPGERD